MEGKPGEQARLAVGSDRSSRDRFAVARLLLPGRDRVVGFTTQLRDKFGVDGSALAPRHLGTVVGALASLRRYLIPSYPNSSLRTHEVKLRFTSSEEPAQ